MPANVSFRDHVSVTFHRLFNSNVSRSTAARLAESVMNMEKVENVQGDIVRAIKQKFDTSRHRDLSHVAQALDHVVTKINEYEQAEQEGYIAHNLQKRLDTYTIIRHIIADKIESYLHYKMRFEVKENLFDYYQVTIADVKNHNNELINLKTAWEKSVDELERVRAKRDFLAGMIDITCEEYQQLIACDKEYQAMQSSLYLLEKKILALDAEVKTLQNIKATAVIDVARSYKSYLPKECCKLLKEVATLEEKITAEPEIMSQESQKIIYTK